MKEQTEIIDFEKCNDYEDGIHREECYTMFKNNQSGLAKISYALRQYHSPKKLKRKYSSSFEAGFTESFVGEPHMICECLQRLQFLRFQTVCTMQINFITHVEDQQN